METLTTGIIGLALGMAVLFLGKSLRLFAMATGFLIGVSVMQALFPGGSLLVAALVGVALAIAGAVLLAVAKGFVQLIIQLLGALAGAGIAMWLASTLGIAPGLFTLIAALAGAVIGFILMARFFDIGIIILTSLLGASLVANAMQSFLPLSDGVSTIATLILALVGFIVQRRN
jgi:hypothetical protein